MNECPKVSVKIENKQKQSTSNTFCPLLDTLLILNSFIISVFL